LIYICIPTYNEQQTVGVVLWKLRQVLTEFPREYQLLVADDASTDKTPEVLEPYTRVLPLTVIRSDRRMGQAACMEMLLREAVRRSEYPKRDIVITLQADFSEEPDDIVPMIKRIEAGADVAVGNKVSMTKPDWRRRLARRLGSMFASSQTWPEGVASPFDGYRAYRLYGVKRAIEERSGRRLLRYDGWAGSAELLRLVMPHARRVDVIDVEDRPDRLQRPRRERPFAAARSRGRRRRPQWRGAAPPAGRRSGALARRRRPQDGGPRPGRRAAPAHGAFVAVGRAVAAVIGAGQCHAGQCHAGQCHAGQWRAPSAATGPRGANDGERRTAAATVCGRRSAGLATRSKAGNAACLRHRRRAARYAAAITGTGAARRSTRGTAAGRRDGYRGGTEVTTEAASGPTRSERRRGREHVGSGVSGSRVRF
jgi:hypothetical protein